MEIVSSQELSDADAQEEEEAPCSTEEHEEQTLPIVETKVGLWVRAKTG